MTRQIRVRPSGHRVEVQSAETILEAGLRAGLNLDCHCGNGSCGDCRARLLSGEVRETCQHDFRFSAAEQAENWLLMCCTTPVSDIEIEALEAGGAADIPFQELTAKLSRLERLNDQVTELHLRTPRSQSLRFLAGQHVRLSVAGAGAGEYAVASCPCDGLHLRLHVKRRERDPFNDYLFERARKGDSVSVHGPTGEFTLDENSDRALVFVAYETGFAPINSLIEHAIALETLQPMALYRLSAGEQGQYLANYCRSWVDALDEFRFRSMRVAGPADMPAVIADIAAAHAPLQATDFYLAIPESASQPTREALERLGLPAAQLRIDSLDHA